MINSRSKTRHFRLSFLIICSFTFLKAEALLSSNINLSKVQHCNSLRSWPSNLKTRRNGQLQQRPPITKSLVDDSKLQGEEFNILNLWQKVLKFKTRVIVGLLFMAIIVPLRASASTPIIESTVVAAEALAPPVMTPIPADVELKLCLRLIYSAFLGACLGKERSAAKHSAGVRTMALVAMGASAFTVCSAFGFAQVGRFDPSRMASNVASGVGFVGAGVITTTHMNEKNNMNVVHGLTTAASIWISAAVGVACGTGLHRVATAAAFSTIFILRLGRMGRFKPKVGNESSLHVNRSLPNQRHLQVQVDKSKEEEDEAEDQYAEIHDTSIWDEHPDAVRELIDNPEKKVLLGENTETKATLENERQISELIAVDHDRDVEDLVVEAWNSTKQEILYSAKLHFNSNKSNRSNYIP